MIASDEAKIPVASSTTTLEIAEGPALVVALQSSETLVALALIEASEFEEVAEAKDMLELSAISVVSVDSEPSYDDAVAVSNGSFSLLVMEEFSVRVGKAIFSCVGTEEVASVVNGEMILSVADADVIVSLTTTIEPSLDIKVAEVSASSLMKFELDAIELSDETKSEDKALVVNVMLGSGVFAKFWLTNGELVGSAEKLLLHDDEGKSTFRDSDGLSVDTAMSNVLEDDSLAEDDRSTVCPPASGLGDNVL